VRYSVGLCIIPIVGSVVASFSRDITSEFASVVRAEGFPTPSAPAPAPLPALARHVYPHALVPVPRARTEGSPPPIDAGPQRAWIDPRQVWQSETADPDGSENVAAYASSLLETVDGGRLLQAVDCRQSACRLVLAMADLKTLQRLLRTAFDDEQRWTHAFEVVEGAPRLTVYLQRDVLAKGSSTDDVPATAARQPSPRQ
jgi:hypothetical protein